MKKIMGAKSLFGLAVLMFAGTSMAADISVIAGCPDATNPSCDEIEDAYSFLWAVTADTTTEDGDTGTFSSFFVTLTNTSADGEDPDPLIDLVAFNLAEEFVIDSTISFTAINPNWSFSAGSGGVRFDYVGARDAPDQRLAITESLTFTINFLGPAYYDHGVFLDANQSAGKGIGGGQDIGQVCVSFQQLAARGVESDLVCGTYGDIPFDEVSEPATLGLLGLGLMAAGFANRRRRVS